MGLGLEEEIAGEGQRGRRVRRGRGGFDRVGPHPHSRSDRERGHAGDLVGGKAGALERRERQQERLAQLLELGRVLRLFLARRAGQKALVLRPGQVGALRDQVHRRPRIHRAASGHLDAVGAAADGSDVDRRRIVAQAARVGRLVDGERAVVAVDHVIGRDRRVVCHRPDAGRAQREDQEGRGIDGGEIERRRGAGGFARRVEVDAHEIESEREVLIGRPAALRRERLQHFQLRAALRGEGLRLQGDVAGQRDVDRAVVDRIRRRVEHGVVDEARIVRGSVERNGRFASDRGDCKRERDGAAEQHRLPPTRCVAAVTRGRISSGFGLSVKQATGGKSPRGWNFCSIRSPAGAVGDARGLPARRCAARARRLPDPPRFRRQPGRGARRSGRRMPQAR